jgi:hypothetical protein
MELAHRRRTGLGTHGESGSQVVEHLRRQRLDLAAMRARDCAQARHHGFVQLQRHCFGHEVCPLFDTTKA